MKVKIEELKPGYILGSAVMGKTNNPIIPEQTEITEQHIEILKAFLVEEVEIVLSKDIRESTKTQQQTTPETYTENLSFFNLYKQAVQQYKREFQAWQSGVAVNISNVRVFLIPLLEKSLEDKEWIYHIHKYCDKNEYFYHHPIAVSVIAALMAKGLGYDKGQCLQIALAGCLADCGMAKISERTLINAKTLTDNEWVEIKKHPIFSYQMVKDISLLKPETKLAIFQHHERLDGSGYPIGEKGNRIHEFSQIIAIADIYHAMTTERLYKSKQTLFKTLQIMEEDQFGKLNISILKELITLIASLPVGTKVQLSNGQIGSVLFIKPETLTRPLIKIDGSNEIIDLEKTRHLYIEKVIY